MSLETIQKITLDFTVPRIKNVRCVENDQNSRIINIVITNDGKEYPLNSSTMSAKCKIHKPDHTYIYNEAPINSDGSVTINLTDQAMAIAGNARAELQISDSTGKILSTMPFNIIVEKSVLSNKDIESKNESDVINGMINHLADCENPHKTTKDQVGLGLADNTPDIAKNVNSAKKLTTARKINGTSFDGTADITTNKWGAARNISLSGDVSGETNTDGSTDIAVNVMVKDDSHNHTSNTLPTATSSMKGVTTLTNSVTSTSTTTAATPNSVKTAYDKAVSVENSLTAEINRATAAESELDGKKVSILNATASTISDFNLSPSVLNVEGEDVGIGNGDYYSILNIGNYSRGNFRSQLGFPYQNNITDTEAYIRTANNTEWRPWRQLIHSGNIKNQSVNYANKAGAVDNIISGYIVNSVASENLQALGISANSTVQDVWNALPKGCLAYINSNSQSNNWANSLPVVKGCVILYKDVDGIGGSGTRGFIELHGYDNAILIYVANIYNSAIGTWKQMIFDTDSVTSAIKAKQDADGNVITDTYAKKSIYNDSVVSMGRKSGTTVGTGSFAYGYDVTASKFYSRTLGYKTEANADHSTAIGSFAITNGNASFAAGRMVKTNNYASCVFGKYNKEMSNGGVESTQVGDVFVIGNGNSSSALSNAFRVTYTGETYGLSAFNSSGADYAEFIKPWADGNVNDEDRVGYFVTIKEGLLYKANDGDYIAGITSGNPSIVGNADEDYYWRYERDEFNRIVMEDMPEMIQKTDEYGNPIFDEKTGEPIMIETGNIISNARMKLADDYNPDLQNGYVERKYRKEWDYVGMLGILPVRDDGTCLTGQFCKCDKDGIATLATERTSDTFMVIERISDNIISVILK